MRFIPALLAIAFSLSACATSGTAYKEAHKEYKPIPKGQSRIFVYRDNSPIGWAVQPSIFLDGEKIRNSVPNSFTMRDVKPGAHAVTNEGEVEKRIDFTLKPGEAKYIREEIGMGWLWGRIHLVEADEVTAEKEMQYLHEQTFTPEAK